MEQRSQQRDVPERQAVEDVPSRFREYENGVESPIRDQSVGTAREDPIGDRGELLHRNPFYPPEALT